MKFFTVSVIVASCFCLVAATGRKPEAKVKVKGVRVGLQGDVVDKLEGKVRLKGVRVGLQGDVANKLEGKDRPQKDKPDSKESLKDALEKALERWQKSKKKTQKALHEVDEKILEALKGEKERWKEAKERRKEAKERRQERIKEFRKAVRLTRNRFRFELGMEKDEEMFERTRFKTKRGKTKARLDLKYRNVRIYGASIVAETEAGAFTGNVEGFVARRLTKDLKGDVRPKVPKMKALHKCKQRNGHRRIQVKDPSMELYIHPGYKIKGHTMNCLVYMVKYFISSSKTVTRPVCVVDANTGEVIDSWEGLSNIGLFNQPRLTASVGGNDKIGRWKYGQNERFPPLPVFTDLNGTDCRLETANVKTYDLQGNWTLPYDPKEFKCSNGFQDPINGAASPLSDAHYLGGKTHGAFMQYLSEPPLKTPLYLFCHFGKQYENAFYYNGYLFFGDGNSTFYPLVSADVMAHETAHGFTESHSNLENTGQAHGISESFSDIVGEVVEYHIHGRNDFQIGYEIFKQAGYALRDLCTPTADGFSIDHVNNWTPGMDGHFSSGIYNKAFCLLVHKPGWDIKKGFIVFTRANQRYWDTTTNFNDGVCGIETAAEDEGLSKADVTAAFNVVGAVCPPPPPPPTTAPPTNATTPAPSG